MSAPRPRLAGTRARWCGALLLLAALGTAVWLQRSTVIDAVGQLRSMSLMAIGVLVLLAGFERWVRADIVRSLMNATGPGRAAALAFGQAGKAQGHRIGDIGKVERAFAGPFGKIGLG